MTTLSDLFFEACTDVPWGKSKLDMFGRTYVAAYLFSLARKRGEPWTRDPEVRSMVDEHFRGDTRYETVLRKVLDQGLDQGQA